MTKFVHIVYVHPVEQGLPNLHKVKDEREFADKTRADRWIKTFNELAQDEKEPYVAVYYGCVNDETGELV
jgi:hypothetical protein